MIVFAQSATDTGFSANCGALMALDYQKCIHQHNKL
jgi:hypothetical protein